MRPLYSYSDNGSEAFFASKREHENPYPDDSMAGLQWNLGYMTEKNIIDQDGDHFNISDTSARVDDFKYYIKVKTSNLDDDLPSIHEVAEVIQVDLNEWPANCYSIASAILESGVLDEYQEKHGKLFLTYGHYNGPISSSSIFAGRPSARHGWLESPLGHVVDPTRYVFYAVEPQMWAGPIDDYDMSGARYREKMSPSVPKIETPNLVKIPLNSKESLAIFDKLLRDRDQNVMKTGQIDMMHLHWLATRPLSVLGEEAPLVLKTLEVMKCEAIMPTDVRKWISDVVEWRQNYEIPTPGI